MFTFIDGRSALVVSDEPPLDWPYVDGRSGGIAVVALASPVGFVVGRADETETASALARQKAKSAGAAPETDSAFALSRSKAKATGTPTLPLIEATGAGSVSAEDVFDGSGSPALPTVTAAGAGTVVSLIADNTATGGVPRRRIKYVHFEDLWPQWRVQVHVGEGAATIAPIAARGTGAISADPDLTDDELVALIATISDLAA